MNQKEYEAREWRMSGDFKWHAGMVVLCYHKPGPANVAPLVFRASQWEPMLVFVSNIRTGWFELAGGGGTQDIDAFPTIPDITHPATKGILLDKVRRWHEAPRASAMHVDFGLREQKEPDAPQGKWVVHVLPIPRKTLYRQALRDAAVERPGKDFYGETEGLALLSALRWTP